MMGYFLFSGDRAVSKSKKKTAAPAKAKSAAKGTAKKMAKTAAPKKAAVAKKNLPKKTAAKKPVAAKKPASKAKAVAKKTEAAKKPAPKMSGAELLKLAAKELQADAKTAKPADKPLAAKAALVTPRPANSNRPDGGKSTAKPDFSANEFVVYPTHGVGKIIGIEKQEIYGEKIEMFVIEFSKEKMVLRVPFAKVQAVGMRRLASASQMKTALDTLKGRARVKRAMWSRRAQEYEAKINSGDPISIAEVVRDLHRNAGQPDQSYSERQIYEAALERLVREYAADRKSVV